MPAGPPNYGAAGSTFLVLGYGMQIWIFCAYATSRLDVAGMASVARSLTVDGP
jgi:hypothetical protein